MPFITHSVFAHAESARYGFSAKGTQLRQDTDRRYYALQVQCPSLFYHRNQTFTIRNTCMESV